MAQPETSLRFEQPRSTFGTWLGVVLLFLVFGLFVWVVIGAMPRTTNYEEKRAQARQEKLDKLHQEVNPQLHDYAWVDQAKGTARIPIHRAMELTVADLAQRKPAPAGPIAAPAPAAAAPSTSDAAAPQPGPQAAAPAVPAPAPAASASPSATPHTAKAGKDSEMEGQSNAEAQPPGAPAGTQPGPSSTPAAGPDSRTELFRFNESTPGPTPVQVPAGTPIPVRGATPRP